MKRIIGWVVASVAIVVSASASAKLPALSGEAKAKGAETAAKTAWTDKVGAFQLCKAMDRVAATYLAEAKKAGKDLKPAPTPPCADPGPFAYTAPAPTPPIEAAGAHSPPATAVAPPSSNVPAAVQNPAKKQ
jgi:hypothetical protein